MVETPGEANGPAPWIPGATYSPAPWTADTTPLCGGMSAADYERLGRTFARYVARTWPGTDLDAAARAEWAAMNINGLHTAHALELFVRGVKNG